MIQSLQITFLISHIQTDFLHKTIGLLKTKIIVIGWSAGRELNHSHLGLSHKCHEHVVFPLWFACILKTPNGK